MSGYVATVSIPGYMPVDDDPPVFDTPHEAWAYLAEEREWSEEATGHGPGDCDDVAECKWGLFADYSDTVRRLREIAAGGTPLGVIYGPTMELGVVYGETPGYHGDHDLGLVYSVFERS